MKKKLQELDKSTYDSASKKASSMGMSALADKFTKHGKERGLKGPNENFTLVLFCNGSETTWDYEVDSIDVSGKDFRLLLTDKAAPNRDPHTYHGSLGGKVEHPESVMTRHLPKEKIVLKFQDRCPALPKTRRDAKKLVDLLSKHGLDTSGIKDLRLMTHGYANFDESRKKRKTINEHKTNHKINKMKKKVIKFNEQEIEKLVKKIIREEKLQKRKSLSEDRTDYEMSGARTRGEYVSNPRERDVTSLFGKYGADVPPTVIRYMRKNPAAIMKRLYKIYGDQIYDYIPQQNVDIEENINECGDGGYMTEDGCVNYMEENRKLFTRSLFESEGKGCVDTKKGCIRKRKSGWIILNNKKGGVWRKCSSKKNCEEQLDAYHANK